MRLVAFLLLLGTTACYVEEPAFFAAPQRQQPPGGEGPQEICGNGIDDDGDGFADEACHAGSEQQACYTGPPATRSTGVCKDGIQRRAEGDVWGPCEGDITPQPERCGDGFDGNCDGTGGPGQPEDGGCCVPSGPEVCNRVDDDCDGLVDEGVVNACGLCPGEICYVTGVPEPGDCTGARRSCSGIVPFEDEKAFTVDPAAAAPDPALIVGLPGTGELAALDPTTLDVRWRIPGPGAARVALLRDGAWILDGPAGSLVRLESDGSVGCTASLGGAGDALVADAFGRAIVSVRDAADRSRAIAFEPDAIDGSKACRPSALAPGVKDALLPSAPTSLAIGIDGAIWSGDAPAARVDPADAAVIEVAHAAAGAVAVDAAGDVWFAGNDVHRVSGERPWDDAAVYERRTGLAASAIAAAAPGVAGLRADALLLFDPSSLSAETFALPAELAGAASLTAEGGAAFVAAGESIGRFTRADGWKVVAPVPGTSVRLDADGSLGGVMPRVGSWTQVLDSGRFDVQWVQLEWLESGEPGSVVEARLAFASSEADLATAPRCGPFRNERALLGACPGANASRFARIELMLAAQPGAPFPVVQDVRFSTTRP